jgi:uncharacterized Fe-S cluster-containing protein
MNQKYAVALIARTVNLTLQIQFPAEDVFKEKYGKNKHHFEMDWYSTEEKAISALDGYMARKTFYSFPPNESVSILFEEAKTAVEKYSI